jgi:tetratricopeptide (TPR) repeat protein
MAGNDLSRFPTPSPEQRRVAAGQFERANQVIATGNFDYGIQLLLTCCKLDPGNLIYRQALRKTEKGKYNNNLRGSRLAFLTTSAAKTKLRAAKASRDYLRVLECGEEILARNPWDVGAQMNMAEAAEALGHVNLAAWTLEQARQRNPQDATVNRALARLYEKRGNFGQAILLWELVRKADPRDIEAQHKAKDLAASDTIARGNYDAVLGRSGTAAPEQEKVAAASPTKPSQQVKVTAERPAKPLQPVAASTVAEDRVSREVAALRKRIQADAANVSAQLQLAAFYRRAGKLDEAREVLQKALIPTSNNFEISLELADLDTEPFRRNLAITEEKLKAKPDDEELQRIRLRLQKEIYSRELELYRQKAERYPTEMAHRLELGIRLLRMGQIDSAITELQAARSDPRQRWRAMLYLGYCFKNRKNWRLAQRNFEEALQNLPPGEESYRKELLFLLAEGAAETGDLARAVEFGYELANIDFGYKEIGRLIDEWQARLQRA